VVIVAACQAAAPVATEQTTFNRVKSEGVVQIGFANEPPLSIAKTDGTVSGEDPEVVRAVMKRFGVNQVDGVLVPFDGLIPALQAKRIDLIGAAMVIRPPRCLEIAFAEPHVAVGNGLMVKKGNPLNIHSYADIAANPQAIYGHHQGGTGLEFAEVAGIPQDRIVIFADTAEMLAGLQSGRVNVIGHGDLTLREMLKTANDPTLEIVEPFTEPLNKSGKPDVSYPAVGFRKADTDFLAAFNTELAAIKASGELLATIEPFGFTRLPPPEVTTASLCAGT
jgi:polar amino acid transport system substrate-binding protein